MSYEVKYRLEFVDEYDRQVRVDIEQDGYTGETISERVGQGFSPLHISIQNQGDPKFETIKATEIELSIFSDNFELEEISEASDKEFLMKVYEAPTEDGELSLKHIGYVIPEIYTEPYVVEPYPVTIRAASIGILNNIRYVTDEYGEFFTGEATLMTVLTRCLNKLDYQLDIWDSINTFEDRILYFDTSPLEEIKIDQAAFLFEENDREKAKTCMEVIEQILKPFVVNFFMDYGRWVIIPMELRGTAREVRIFDYQGTSQSTNIYNPLNKTYDWIEQDQVLEFLPLARNVDSVHEHGEPQNIVRNYQFEDDFITVDKATGEIRYPSEWTLSDAADFLTAQDGLGDIYAGIKETAVDKGGDSKETRTLRFLIFRFDLPNKQNLSVLKRSTTAVFMLSALINDGAYIEQTGTKIIQAGVDRVRFSVDYAGAVYLLDGDINIFDQKHPDLTIDHKFQIKLGSKYLTADGSWTDTETDIILTDLGDQNPGYADIGLSGVATRLRTFDIVSDPVEESGTPVFRIYKPVSEDAFGGISETYAAVAYSTFSVELYPGGLPPDGETLYFTERDVETYSDDFDFTLESGDGPTNFHVSSFLIDTEYGDNLKTENWVRGNLEGSLSEIAINAIFLEYDTKSNLIRGTQKVKGLFDRWFIEYSKGYTVLAGTYDQRLCRFNGEMVQILNAEVDVWGEELEPGPNFEVIVATEPTTDFSDEDFYVIDDDQSGSPRYHLHKAIANSVDGIVIQTSVDLDDDYYIAVKQRSGHVVIGAYDASSNTFTLDRYDSGLTTKVNTYQISGIGFDDEPVKIFVDYDDSIYVPYVKSGPQFYVRKIEADLSAQIWEYQTVDDARFWVGGNVTKNYAILITNPPTGNTEMRVIDKTNGSEISETAFGFRGSLDDGGAVINFPDGEYLVAVPNGSGDEVWFRYSSDGTLENSGTVLGSSYNISSSYRVADALSDDYVVFVEDNDNLAFFDRDMVHQFTITGAYISTDVASRIFPTTNTDRFLFETRNSGNDTGHIYELIVSTQTTTLLGSYTTAGIQPESSYGYAMKIENWNVRAPVEIGTPTITNVVLSADPQAETVPFSSTITFGADNTGDADITLLLTLDGVEIDSLTIPAGGSASDTYVQDFANPGSFLVEFAGDSLTITANGNDVTGDFEGWIDIDSAADDDTEEVQPDANVDMVNLPSQQSDPCGTGGTEFNVEWKLTDYCMILPDGPDKPTAAQAVSGSISSTVTGLGSTYEGLSPSGFPRIRVYSETFGVADNGEGVTLGVPVELEGNGGVFSKYEIFLTGGVDEYIVNEQIDVLIGGSVFATTSAITALETADSIAQKIYDACVAVGSGTYTFAKNGTRVLVGSTAGAETLDLDIKNAGFSYSTQNIQ